ncbi:unnamed protein product [Caenorhabditis brenneri]
MGPVKVTNCSVVLFFVLLACCFVSLSFYVKVNRNRTGFENFLVEIGKNSIKKEQKTMIRCKTLLAAWNTTVPVLMIDSTFLNELNNLKCRWNTKEPITIGVDAKYKPVEAFLFDNRFRVIYYTNNASKDFLDFDVDGRRIIPRRFETWRIGNLEVPKNIDQFIGFWKRSKLVNCVGLKVKREESMKVEMPALISTEKIARLRDELIDNGMFPFLHSGTLLGWYRECSFIPHTTDLDLAVSYDNYNPEYLKKLENDETQFKIIRRLGMINDSLEITVVPKKEGKPNIDIFLMYDGIENGTITHSYISGLAGDGTKYKFSFPVYDPWCAAELHDHIFWVTCSPKSQIVFEHGDYWYLDSPSPSYTWNKSSKNVKANGKFTAEQMKEVYVVY